MKTKNPVRFILSLAVLLLIIIGWNSASANFSNLQTGDSILHVKPGEDGDCSSWDDACDLQTALSLAEAGDQVWVAAGTYKPTTDTDHLATFHLESGVEIFGGFPEDGGVWEERDWETNLTIMSGDIDNNDNNTDGNYIAETAADIQGDNAYHVVTGSGTDSTAVLDGFVITAGQANGYESNIYGGGMISDNGSPTLTNLTFSGNYAHQGGGLYNLSNNSALENVLFTGNSAMYGGGMYNQDSNPILTTVTFSANTASNEGGGMKNVLSNSTLTSVSFSGNLAGKGGGMHNDTSESTLSDATFSDNSSTQLGYGGAGIYNNESTLTLTNVTFSTNSTTQWGSGAGIYAEESTLTLSHVLFTGNSTEYGGGMYIVDSSATLTNVSFLDNSASDNGGGMYVYEGSAELTNVTFANNSAQYDGGGMCNSSYYSNTGGIQLTNVTFSNNSAGDEGGGMCNDSRSALLKNVTFTGNSALYGGGLYQYYGSASVFNAILWGNTVDQVYIGSSASAAIINSDVQGGYPGTGNIDLNPLLGELADNGGFTMTHAILAGSPVIDSGSNEHCSSTDQRGYPRPYDGDDNGIAICDMGTFEVQPYTLTINTTGNGQVTVSPENPTYNYDDVVSLTAIAAPHWTFSGWSGDATGTDNPLTITIHSNTNITANFLEYFEIYLPLILRN